LLNYYWFSFIGIDILRGIETMIKDGFFLTHKILIVPILTGSALMEFNSIKPHFVMDPFSFYRSAFIPVDHFSEDHATQLTYETANLPLDGGEYKENKLCKLFIAVGGGVALWHRYIGEHLRDRPTIQTMDDVQRLWLALLRIVALQYHASLNEYIFH
jgi:hypothetical protein